MSINIGPSGHTILFIIILILLLTVGRRMGKLGFILAIGLAIFYFMRYR